MAKCKASTGSAVKGLKVIGRTLFFTLRVHLVSETIRKKE